MIISNSEIISTPGPYSLSSGSLLSYIHANIHTITYKTLFKWLEQATTVVNQVIIRTAISSKDGKKDFVLTIEMAERKAQYIVDNRRKRFVRRVWKKYPLFALQLIKERYVDYSEELLIKDLYVQSKKNKKEKFKKNIASFGLRISQIQKLSWLLKSSDTSEKERNTICNKIAGYMNGLKLKAPIVLTVNYSGILKEYNFKWNDTESRIKTFLQLTKEHKTFEALDSAWNNRFSYGN